MPIEDPTVTWNGGEQVKLATITIPKQSIGDAERNVFCENLSFNPWRVPKDNAPMGLIVGWKLIFLGGAGRTRKLVYEDSAKARRKLNSYQYVNTCERLKQELRQLKQKNSVP